MAFPTAAKQALEALRQGPVSVVFNPDTSPVEVFVNSGLNMKFGRGQANAEVDMIGIYDKFTVGDEVTFELKLPETSKNIVDLLFADQLDGTTYRGFGTAAGKSARTNAKPVRIRPWQTRDSATVQVDFWKVVPDGDTALDMTKADPHTFTQTFRALPDLTKSDGELLGKLTFPARA